MTHLRQDCRLKSITLTPLRSIAGHIMAAVHLTPVNKTLAGVMLLGIILLSKNTHAETIHIAVASNFSATMVELVESFEQKTGHEVKLSFGSSGKFYAQISHGAPFQLLFSADQAKPIALEKDGLAIKGSRITYAEGSLALWSTKPNFANLQAQTLSQREFHKLALANPRLAPYGQAALEVLKNLNLVDATQSKWVQGENISQTYQFVDSGNADLGFVALSQIMNKGEITKGSAWLIPHELYNPIRQDAVLLERGGESPAAHEFMEFIHSTPAKKIIESYGYKTAPPSLL